MTLGSRLGIGTTLLIIVITGIIGASLTRSQGRQALARFQQTTGQGRLPAKEAFDGILILIAGAVLLTPGFLTDALGFALLLEPIRTLVGTHLIKNLKDRIQIVTPGTPPPKPTQKPKSKLDNGDVIDV